jgi:hypothetical protein
MSTLTEEGVMAVKQTACDRLLNFRVELKVAGKRISDVLNRMHVAVPKNRCGQLACAAVHMDVSVGMHLVAIQVHVCSCMHHAALLCRFMLCRTPNPSTNLVHAIKTYT